jgi:hypothetical protein
MYTGTLPAPSTASATATATSSTTTAASANSTDAADNQKPSPQQDLNQVKLLPPSADKAFTLNSQIQWQSFEPLDSTALETVFQTLPAHSSPKMSAEFIAAQQLAAAVVPVGDDFLYEVDIINRTMYPIYWEVPFI